jgi:hypothetical protein
MTNDIPQCDHLILLVGGNPLPNAVAGQLLAAPDATIWLLHSDGADGEPSTKTIAENLETFLQQKNERWTIKLEPIPSTNKQGIENRVREILGEKGQKLNGRVGLHYTGGTKSMSVHTYRVLERVLSNRQPRPTFSYLDPRQLALRIDGEGTDPDHIFPLIKNDTLRQRLEMLPDNLAQLHGYGRAVSRSNWANPDNTPGLLALCQEIAKLNSDPNGFQAWHKWVYKEQHRELPTSEKNPELKPVIAAFNTLCGVAQATSDMVAAKLIPHATSPRLTACQSWFRGEWLEEYVFWCAKQARHRQIYIIEKGLHYKRPDRNDDFDLDIVVLMGYQLFVISCITTNDKDRAKEHLLEAYVRTRQLGGDEACVALVCCYSDASRLQAEVSNAWDAAGKVKVFGQSDLQKLTQCLAEWFQQGN